MMAGVALLGGATPMPARAQTVQDLQRQIDELKATIAELKAAQASRAPVAATPLLRGCCRPHSARHRPLALSPTAT